MCNQLTLTTRPIAGRTTISNMALPVLLAQTLRPGNRLLHQSATVDCHSQPSPLNFFFGPATPALSATAAKVDPHLLVPGAGAALLGSLDAAGDEVRSAVAVPVRHANAGGLPVFVVGDEQLW